MTAGYPVTRSNVESLKGDLSLLTKLARKLRKDREDIGGAVDLSSGDQGNELKFSLDANHQPLKVTPKQQLEIHQTVAGTSLDTFNALSFISQTMTHEYSHSTKYSVFLLSMSIYNNSSLCCQS
ncbi:MAG: hypothetical protein ACI8RD_001097 [Bacillariaceae sp.]